MLLCDGRCNVSSLCSTYDAVTSASLLGITFTQEQLAAFGEPPRAIEGFITFFDPGFSIVELEKLVRKVNDFLKAEEYETEPFATKGTQAGYRQLRMQPVDGSLGKSFDDQVRLLANNEEVPSPRVAMMGAYLHFLATRERLFANCRVRCLERRTTDQIVCVGKFEEDGFDFCDDFGGFYGVEFIGLASVRKG